MTEKVTPFPDMKADADTIFDRIKSDVDRLIDELNFEEMGRKVQDFGRQKPVVLAIAAFTVGIAAGLLMRRDYGGESKGYKH